MDRRRFLASAGASVAALALSPVAAVAAAETVTIPGWVYLGTELHIGPGPRFIRWSERGDYETWSPSAT